MASIILYITYKMNFCTYCFIEEILLDAQFYLARANITSQSDYTLWKMYKSYGAAWELESPKYLTLV